MTLLELRDLKGQILEDNDKVFLTADAEKRNLSENEEATVEMNLRKVKDLDLKIETEMRKESKPGIVIIGKTISKPKEDFSLIRAIRAKINQREMPEVARDVFTYGLQEFRNSGINPEGDLFVPAEVRANILAGTTTAGEEIVAEDKKAILPPLVDKLIFSQAGATYMTGLVGDVSIPTYAGTTVAWKTEVEAAADGGSTFDEVNFSPKRLTAFILVSKQFLLQDGVGAERLLLDNISNAIARKLESTILGVAAGSATQPQGMGYYITTGADTLEAGVVPDWASLVTLETTVDTSNALIGNLAYITNGTGRGMMKSLAKDDALSHGYLVDENGLVNGYPLLVTNSCSNAAGSDAKTLLLFGNWADLCIAQWGGYDITVDPYSAAATGQVKIVINAYFDAKGLRGTVKTDEPSAITDPWDYAKSFSSLAIKAS